MSTNPGNRIKTRAKQYKMNTGKIHVTKANRETQKSLTNTQNKITKNLTKIKIETENKN